MKTDWAEVYRTISPELFRFLHRKVWDEERAKDLVQECFTRALVHDPDKPRQWLFQVAANLAKDDARLVIRRKRHLALLRVEASSQAGPLPDEELNRSERSERLRQALEELSDRDREVLLFWDSGQSYVEIAEHTGLSQGAIGTTLARARKRLVESFDALERKDAALG